MMAGRDTFEGIAGGPARHIPVLLQDVMDVIAPRDGGIYIDGTFGAGGYSRAFLDAAECTVLALDRDPEATAAGAALVRSYQGRLILRDGRFSELDAHASDAGFDRVDGVALDIGVSSMQLDEAERGFSFMQDGPLDMRMSRSGPSAADIVNTYEARDLARIIKVLGDEKRGAAIARAIVQARGDAPIDRTGRLAEIVSRAVGGRRGQRIHPATRTFQALRIHVNRELDELALGLFAAEKVLAAGGRLAVVSFHSLEDRIVKRFMAAASGRDRSVSRHMPDAGEKNPSTFTPVNRGATGASDNEASANPRARSARLRGAERTDAPARAADFAALGLPRLAPLPGERGEKLQ